MAVQIMFRCPITGKVWDPKDTYKEVIVEKKVDEEGNEVEEVKEWELNSVTIGFYDHDTHQMKHLAYGRDICPDKMREIAAVVLQGEDSKIKIHEVKQKEKKSKKPAMRYADKKEEKVEQKASEETDDGK